MSGALRQFLHRRTGEARSLPSYCRASDRRNPESFTLAAWLIENEMVPPAWAEAFQQVKFDTADNPEWEGERYIVIVAKGDRAAQLVEAYGE